MHLEILEEKYGEAICNQLLEDGKLKPENIAAKNEQSQGLVKKQISKINSLLDLGLDVENTDWAFDFSGWIGSLARKGESKRYMIIGLEPHIERYDYQITYGLSERTPKGEERFSIDSSETWEIRCNDDSSLIWTTLFKLMADDNQKKEVLQHSNEKVLKEFLHQFYITDLCHFAPQDKAKAVHDIKDWKKIRAKVAGRYLQKEIEAVNPEVILTQGNGVFNELKGILKFRETESYPLNYNNWSIKTGVDLKGNYKVLSLPHFGTLLNYKTFYKKHVDAVRKILINNELI